MLNPPTGVTLADYISASLAQNQSHVRLTFLTQNVVFEDADIEASGLTISNVLNGETNIRIGKAVSRELTVSIFNSNKTNGLIWTSNVKLEYGIEIGGTTKWVTVGYFIGTRPEKLMDVDVIQFTAMDAMQKFDVLADDWLKTPTYPKTTLQLFQSLCTFCGVGYVTGDELANIKARSFATAPINQTGMLCRDILGLIAEACGCYARINADGNCQMVWFKDQTSSYSLTGDDEFSPVVVRDHVTGKTWADLESYTWAELENVTWGDLEGTINQFKIEAVNVRNTEEDIGVYYPNVSNGNTYIIVDNPFLMTANQTEVNNYIAPLYTRLNGLGGYIPTNLSAVGCILVESGDIINITANSETIRLPIFVKTMQWNGGLTDTMESTGDPITSGTVPSGVRQQLSEGGRYHIFRNTIDELYSELYDPTTGDVSILQQIASGLGMSANQIDLQAGKKLLLESGAEIEVKSGGDINIGSGGNFSVVSGGSVDINASGDFNLNANTFKVNSTNMSIDNETGEIEINGANSEHILIDKDGAIFQSGAIPIDKHTFAIGKPAGATDGISASLRQRSNGDLVLDFADHNVSLNCVIVFEIDSIIKGGLLYGATLIRPNGDLYAKLGNSSYRFSSAYIDQINYGTLTQNSSKDIKHDIKPLPSVGEKLDKLKPVTFVYDDDEEEKTRHGLIYEDTMQVMPEICTGDESSKAINYVELIPMLLKEIQELRARVKALEEREDR